MWEVHYDYQWLQDPFSNDKDDIYETTNLTDEQVLAITAAGDEPTMLKEVRESPDWPEWEKVIKAKLDQHQKMGTWILVDKLADTIPIANKWVFIKKWNKDG